ncbi:M24 family metallopeptidase [Sutcliffiella horikoshii]|uniref:M24 family metallopeptidase n=1 Tax=Sutcliffiella horikoshii TaxID=79883 RepID=UPI001CFDB9F1|nr:Xaa-Pro peptidase family protein [Sutcliffiella horikoshii]
MLRRIEKLRKWLNENHCDAFFLNTVEDYRYFSGFTGSNCYLFVSKKDAILVTDQRYSQQIQEETEGYKIYIHEINPFTTLEKVMKFLEVSSIAYDGKKTSVSLLKTLRNLNDKVDWVYTEDVSLGIRQYKEPSEEAAIQRAAEIGDLAFKDLCQKIKPGMTEKQIAVELEYLLAKHGSEGPTFGTIVAAGDRSALPHATPTSRVVKENDMLLIDFGARFEGYMSDMTRTLWIGEPNVRMQEIYMVVLEALEKAIVAVSPGVTCHELDNVARKVFIEANLEEYSLRGLGHGVGLEIHEWPRVVMQQDTPIQKGHIFTIEPGLYIPELGGVRIEELVSVTKSGCKLLTGTPRTIRLT